MEILFLVGLTIFLGTLGGKLCQRYKVPQVTGYIIIGLFLGQSSIGLGFWSAELIQQFTPLVNLALGVIGFMIGSELKLELFKKRGKSIYWILFCEVFITFAVTCFFVSLLTNKFYLGLIFGALAAATAPAATVDVLWENKTRGPLTSTILAIVALDDVLALFIYGFASVIARSIITHEQLSFIQAVEQPFLETGAAIAVGVSGAYVLYGLTHFIKDRDRILPFSFGVIMLTVGLSVIFKLDLILSSMFLGFMLTNIAPQESKEIFSAIKRVSNPLYVLFFALVGARLDFSIFMGAGVALLATVYLLSRNFGKVAGAVLGGFIGGASEMVTKYLGICLFSQAGVAIGMAISINQSLSHYGPQAQATGMMIVNVIVATTFVVQLIGPLCVRIAVIRAGEVGKDVNEEDIVDSHKVLDMLEKNVPTIREDTRLDDIVSLVKESDSYDFCVVNGANKLLGYISIGDLRDVLLEKAIDLGGLVMAKDIAVPATRVIAADRPLKEALVIFRRKDLSFLPVVKDEKNREFVGLIHYKEVMAEIEKELLGRRGTD